MAMNEGRDDVEIERMCVRNGSGNERAKRVKEEQESKGHVR